MYRPYSPQYYADLVTRVRQRIPDAGIGADVMVGFPGETDADFQETYELIESLPLTYLHIFPYSSRPGTVAAGLPNHIPDHVSRFRGQSLRDLIQQKNESFRLAHIGKKIEVLTLEEGAAISSNFLRVRVPAVVPANTWIRLSVEGLTGDGLLGSTDWMQLSTL
jgi:threonylcarbamoyladenosine tRNA methylthiotransferase MtaB